MKSKLFLLSLQVALVLFVCLPLHADVLTPPAPPAPPAGYCSTIYNELQGYLDSFNQTLGNPAPYPTLQFSQLQMADSNAGPSISSSSFLSNVMLQVQELKAMGFQGVKVQVAFPVLYEPFYSSHADYLSYLTLYQSLAQNLKTMGMKLLVENNVTLSTGDEAGWPNIGTYYKSLSWDQFVAARATMSATIAQYMQPDFLMVSQEPDNEAANAGQPNLNTASYAAAMIAAQIAAVRAVSINVQVGAGFGTWMGPYSGGLQDFINAYLALPIDYLDMHIYPINTEYNGLSNLLQNTLVIADAAAVAGKPIAISESWMWKMEDHEFNVLTPDLFRARNPFSFWAPLDIYFIQTMQKLANYTQMLYLTTQGNVYLQASQTYGGTTANGGAANCTCTTASCSNGDITATQNNLAINAGYAAAFTPTGIFYNSVLVSPPDTESPTDPSGLTGNVGYTSVTIMWTGSTSDNIGVAGYNILRCTPSEPNGDCKGEWVANSAGTSYYDMGLNDDTEYHYTVQAFDFANNTSNESNLFVAQTWRNSPPTSVTNLTATPTSPTQIKLTWTPPLDSGGLNQYLIYQGTTPASMIQVGNIYATYTSYTLRNLLPMTNYCFGVIAVVQNLNSPMSNVVCVTTLPLPNSPSSVVATPVSASRITLTWKEMLQPGGLAIANYQVYQGTVEGIMTKVATTTATTYNAMSLSPATTYYFEVVAVDKSYNASTPSDPVRATTYPLPAAPSNIQATFPGATKFKLTWQWTQVPGGLPAARFSVYCGTSPTGQPKLATTTAYAYTYVSAAAGTQYYCYLMAADTANDNSLASPVMTFVTPPMPNAPTNVVATATKATMATVTWSEILPPGGLPVTSYKIYRSNTLPVTTANFVATRTTMSYTDTTVTASKTYYYAIQAISSQDASPLSQPAQVTTPVK